mgnify:CR=1 FL=1
MVLPLQAAVEALPGLERALAAGEVDLVVHSLKDLPTENPEGLMVGAIPERAPIGDVLLVRPDVLDLDCDAGGLPVSAGATVGTSAARRRALLAHLDPRLVGVDLRGNVPTRVEKCLNGEADAIVLAVYMPPHVPALRRGVERGQVTMLGPVEYGDLPALYAAHDVFITPSLSETFGHPLVEAMASEALVVASDTPVHREVCGDSAAYFSATSIGDIVKTLRALDADPTRRAAMLKRAYEIGNRDYSWEGHVDRLLNYFEAVSAGRVR